MRELSDAEWTRQVTACEHGRQRRKCEVCRLIETESDNARLTAELTAVKAERDRKYDETCEQIRKVATLSTLETLAAEQKDIVSCGISAGYDIREGVGGLTVYGLVREMADGRYVLFTECQHSLPE